MPDPRDLCTVANVKEGLETSETTRDAWIQTLITDASVAIMQDTGREFAPVTASATRRFQIDGYTVSLEPYDLRTVTTMTLHPESGSPQVLTANTDYQLQPVVTADGVYQGVALSGYLVLLSDTAFKFGYALLDIAGAWGFSAVPADVKHACIETVRAWLRADVGALGLGDLLGDAGPTLGPKVDLPWGTKNLIAPYRRLASMAF